jgi:putative transcriptional regulator
MDKKPSEVKSRVQVLRTEKEQREGRKISLDTMAKETGVSVMALQRLTVIGRLVERVDGATLGALCRYFDCGVGDLLEFVQGETLPTADASTTSAIASSASE